MLVSILDQFAKLRSPVITDDDFTAVLSLVDPLRRSGTSIGELIMRGLAGRLLLVGPLIRGGEVGENSAVHPELFLGLLVDVRQLPEEGLDPFGVLAS